MELIAVKLCDTIETNAYFYIDEQTKHGFLIDPAAEPQKLQKIITEQNWIIEKMLITHGHFDHIGAVEALYKELGIPYFAHIEAQKYLTNPQWNLSIWGSKEIILNDACYLHDGDIISLENNPDVKFEVIASPGHTLDGVVYYEAKNKIAFVGDSIFKGAEGRTDLYGGDANALQNSIKKRILTLPDDTVLYSGHSDPTTVKQEKIRYNQ